MACSEDGALIDFRSPAKGRIEFHTPLVPAPNTAIENNQLVPTGGENPFDFVVDQIKSDNKNDPIESIFEKACQSNNEDVKSDNATPLRSYSDRTQKISRPNDYSSFQDFGKKSVTVETGKQHEIAKMFASKYAPQTKSVSTGFKIKNVLPGEEISILDESSPCLDNTSDSILNLSTLSCGLVDEHLDDYCADKGNKMGEQVEQELSRSLEMTDHKGFVRQTKLEMVPPRIANVKWLLETPAKGNVHDIIADRIHKCIQRGLNDSQINLSVPNHHRSCSSPLMEYDKNVSILAAVSCATGLNFKAGQVSSFELFESPLAIKKPQTICESLCTKNSTISTPRTELLEKFNAIKGGLMKNYSGYKLSRSFSDVSQKIQQDRLRDSVLQNGLNSVDSNISRARSHKRHSSVVVKRSAFPDLYAMENKNLPQPTVPGIGYLRDLRSSSCPASNESRTLYGGNEKCSISRESQSRRLHVDAEDLNDSVFSEAKSLANHFKYLAEHDECNDEEENFLSGRLEVPPLYSSSASESSDIDEPNKDFKNYAEKNILNDILPSNYFSLNYKSANEVLTAEGCVDGQKALRRCNSDSSSATAQIVPSELSREKLKTQSYRDIKKVQLPSIVPVPMMGNRDVIDKKLKRVKPQRNLEPLKKGPMKAVIPVGNMMRNPPKKASLPGGRSRPGNRNLVKSSINTSGVKLMPMAQSTPELNRKGTGMPLKMCSPIPYETPAESPISICSGSDLPKSDSKTPNSLPTVTSQVSQRPSKLESGGNQPKSRTYGSGMQQGKHQKLLKSTDNMEVKRNGASKLSPPNLKNKVQQVSTPLRSLTKNSRNGRFVPSIKPEFQVAANVRKRSVPSSEKENITPL